MVLLRELDGAKDYPLVIHPVGSDWERQVRSHYTRADGSLNINGYYSEMFGFTVKSSDFESGSSDSDSDSSGNDSDCVIISSSEFSSTNPNNRSLIVVDFVATISTSMEISSRFTTDKFVSTFRQAVQVSGEGGENRVVIDPVALVEFVTTVNEQEPHYFYMYTHVLQTLHLWLPFNSFECQILRNVSPHSLISISSQPNKGRFSLYASNFKNYRDTFVRFRCGEGFPELMFDVSGNRLFPFYLYSSPRLIKGTRTSTFNEYDRLAVSALSRFQVLSSVELISREDKPQSLGEYMASMSTLSAQQRAALVLKARAQRAEAERAAASADAMFQLLVEESGVKNTKRKNPEESGKIPVEIPKKRKNTVVDEEEAEIEDEPLKFRRMSKSRGLTSLDSGEGGSNAVNKGKGASSQCCPSNPEARKGKKRQPLRQRPWIIIFRAPCLPTTSLTARSLSPLTSETRWNQLTTSLSALEKEFTAAKSKFEEDLAAMKAEQEEKVKAAVKAKEDEVVALKEKVKTLEGELTEEKAKAKTQKQEASLNMVALTARIEKLEIEGANQFDEGFRFALDQVKVAFPDVDAVKLGKLDSVNQIVEGKIVPYVPPPSEYVCKRVGLNSPEMKNKGKAAARKVKLSPQTEGHTFYDDKKGRRKNRRMFNSSKKKPFDDSENNEFSGFNDGTTLNKGLACSAKFKMGEFKG
ncbi:hypothetical protein TSUD_277250 [Trifolium subterraneum]|uniref:Uncharacterized protein n=1 Tax=Trifolium subterraneum TaxID=3900 RepID=A0A2Z6N202_TRISU|nr:hypothetical protein TSUD_277250 [Trifolium subterraneum]